MDTITNDVVMNKKVDYMDVHQYSICLLLWSLGYPHAQPLCSKSSRVTRPHHRSSRKPEELACHYQAETPKSFLFLFPKCSSFLHSPFNHPGTLGSNIESCIIGKASLKSFQCVKFNFVVLSHTNFWWLAFIV